MLEVTPDVKQRLQQALNDNQLGQVFFAEHSITVRKEWLMQADRPDLDRFGADVQHAVGMVIPQAKLKLKHLNKGNGQWVRDAYVVIFVLK